MTKKETIKDGLVEEFHDNGQLKYRGNYKYGKKDGLWENFHENGTLMNRIIYKKGKNIVREFFYENGQVGRRDNHNGQFDGLSEYFDDDGNLTKTEEFNYLKESEEFFKNLTTDPSRNKTR